MKCSFYFILFLRQELLLYLKLAFLPGLVGQQALSIFKPLLSTRVPGCPAEHSFYVSSEDPYSGSQPCAASTLPKEPPPQPEMFALETCLQRAFEFFYIL